VNCEVEHRLSNDPTSGVRRRDRGRLHVLILAAGRGSRLQLGLPKCLVEVGGRPLLYHQLDAIEQVGADRVTLVLGHEHQCVEDAAEGRADVILNERYADTNSLYSFWLARRAVEGDDLLVLNSDVLFAPELLRDLLAVEGSAIAVDSNSGDEGEHMKVRERQGRLLHMSKGLPPMDSHGESLGLVHLSPFAAQAAFSAAGSLVAGGHEDDWVTAAFNEVARRHWISCLDVAGQPWAEIDFPEDLAFARNHTWPAIAALRRERRSGDGLWSTSMPPAGARKVAV
jgi:choline kinase